MRDYTGMHDPFGYELRAGLIAVADELASAAELVCGKIDGIPAALLRGFATGEGEGTAQDLVRDPENDLFR